MADVVKRHMLNKNHVFGSVRKSRAAEPGKLFFGITEMPLLIVFHNAFLNDIRHIGAVQEDNASVRIVCIKVAVQSFISRKMERAAFFGYGKRRRFLR